MSSTPVNERYGDVTPVGKGRMVRTPISQRTSKMQRLTLYAHQRLGSLQVSHRPFRRGQLVGSIASSRVAWASTTLHNWSHIKRICVQIENDRRARSVGLPSLRVPWRGGLFPLFGCRSEVSRADLVAGKHFYSRLQRRLRRAGWYCSLRRDARISPAIRIRGVRSFLS